ncbi:type II toxin-antitoxin system VapC family toxin [Pseudonocardia parietis]|uniref:PIN domain nuclease of toxin-antitoxin system n=1 Tax=Pseudonocardia parietis TaxID=570936 RepID=A0ABS4VVV5_9PSEU|nr:type II toxin-antitoxin system VapC family toxin [Pseudonocardia parietis]MBP2367853.1 PIN domain nuclease of toxin-antitoxin system [Pseudonocardia parietis]
MTALDAGSPAPSRSAGAAEATATPPTPSPAVLDASAVLAWLRDEPGGDVVDRYLDTAVLSAVNLAEVHQKLAQHGVDADRATRQLRTLGVRIAPLDTPDAITAAKLWPATRAAGLSLGDRCCLALAARLGGPAVTADTAWTTLEIGVGVVLIRGSPPGTDRTDRRGPA